MKSEISKQWCREIKEALGPDAKVSLYQIKFIVDEWFERCHDYLVEQTDFTGEEKPRSIRLPGMGSIQVAVKRRKVVDPDTGESSREFRKALKLRLSKNFSHMLLHQKINYDAPEKVFSKEDIDDRYTSTT